MTIENLSDWIASVTDPATGLFSFQRAIDANVTPERAYELINDTFLQPSAGSFAVLANSQSMTAYYPLPQILGGMEAILNGVPVPSDLAGAIALAIMGYDRELSPPDPRWREIWVLANLYKRAERTGTSAVNNVVIEPPAGLESHIPGLPGFAALLRREWSRGSYFDDVKQAASDWADNFQQWAQDTFGPAIAKLGGAIIAIAILLLAFWVYKAVK